MTETTGQLWLRRWDMNVARCNVEAARGQKLSWRGKGLWPHERILMGLPISTWDYPTSRVYRFLLWVLG